MVNSLTKVVLELNTVLRIKFIQARIILRNVLVFFVQHNKLQLFKLFDHCKN